MESFVEELTHKNSHQEASNPLFLDLLDAGLFSWQSSLGHNCQSISMSDSPHCGGTQPGHAQKWCNTSHSNNKKEIEMET